TTSQRVLKYGGSQVFNGGGTPLALSTGPKSAGGDGWQPSHWKIDLGLGIMDPAISNGSRRTIQPNDIAVLNLLGYWIDNEPAPTLPQTSPGNTVAMTSGVAQTGAITS